MLISNIMINIILIVIIDIILQMKKKATCKKNYPKLTIKTQKKECYHSRVW